MSSKRGNLPLATSNRPATSVWAGRMRFIEGLAHSPVDRAITSGIVAAAKAAGRTVVAEFVTDKETLDILAGIEVDCVQGQLIGMPAPVVA